MTVIEYAAKVGVQPGLVYGRIKRGTLEAIIVDGNYDIAEDTPWVKLKRGVKIKLKNEDLPF